MNLEFSRQKLAENIMTLIQQKKLRIGEVEQQIGISTGYLTKMLKKETDAAPSADIIWKLAKVLGVSTDMLIEGDFSKATDNLQYMRKFLYRLQSLTDTNELEWDRISISDVNEALRSKSPSLPIIVTMDTATNAVAKTTYYQGNEVSASIHGKNKIHSVGVDAEPVWVTNSGFMTDLGNETDVYIFPMRCSVRVDEEGNYEDVDYFDIYFGSWRIPDGYENCDNVPDEAYVRHFEPVCNTFNTAQNLSGEVAALYQSILRHDYDLKISSSVRNTIARFLSPDDPDYLPF